MIDRPGEIGDFALIKETSKIHKIVYVISSIKIKVSIPKELLPHFKDSLFKFEEEEVEEDFESLMFESNGAKFYSSYKNFKEFKYTLDDNKTYSHKELIVGLENIRELKLGDILNGIQ